ncbi:hypothetical protein GCM10011571_17020 [Marinithermofilum abyssi]|uniref:Uncharacterized protein n=1 Tax=Marinithermofilum abyssi TaxID=1571185 RepID=A0A8J2VF50_9BACL|nr:hypothetical protein [Marinithermofilum abyssi]GGE16002.1 hypothetical protein GCM10011571_17020 [Marinithermofilum abyssi]
MWKKKLGELAKDILKDTKKREMILKEGKKILGKAKKRLQK